MPRLMKKQCFTAPTSAVHNRKTSLYILPGGVTLQLQSPDPSMYFSKEFQETRVGSPDCSSGYHITNCPGIQGGGGGSVIKSEGRKRVEGRGNAELQGHGQETNLARHMEKQGV